MKKIFVFFMSLMFIMCLVGCGEIKDGELMSFTETDNNYLIEPNCLSKIIKIEVYNSSLEKIEEITDISVINVYISEIKKHIFGRVIMIENSLSSNAVYYNKEYLKYMEEIETSDQILLYFDNNEILYLYKSDENCIFYLDEFKTIYFSKNIVGE